MNEEHTIVPYQKLSKEALLGVIQEFVLREGTDYGHHDWDLNQKVDQVLQQLKNGKVSIVFDHRLQSCTINTTDS